MRIGELARRSGVSIPTIKYYLREGLLPPGAATAPNQASYGEEHLHRLRLIRALLDVGGLTVAAAREVSLHVPLVVRLEGTNVELGKKIMAQSGLPIIAADNLADAAEKVVKAVKEAA